jgi:hypothetical protein
MRPTFQFTSNFTTPEDRSGTAAWRYVAHEGGEYVQRVVEQRFDTFQAAHSMNVLFETAWRMGETEGHAECERKVLAALKT